MGRITIFSADGCPHCKRVKVALSVRDIPFVEVSLTKYPKKRQDMLALSDRVSTPQVFFNTRHVGGADETISLLETWDKDKKQAYASPYERYMAEIGNHFDPTNPRLSLPEEAPVELEAGPDRGKEELSVVLPNGKAATVVETTELLKKILRSGDAVQKMKKQKMSFTGKQAVCAFSTQFCVSEEKAIAFGVQLQKKQILNSIRNGSQFDNSEHLFRMQCYSAPDILNSYRIWTESTVIDPLHLMNRLIHMMNQIEAMVTDDHGSIDYEKAVLLPLYNVFEERVCELQVVSFKCMDDKTKTAFGINLYNLMIKYAFMKVGAGTNGYRRYLFYNQVKFYVDQHVFSFQDWENGVLRGNRKAPFAFGLQFDNNDPRLDWIVKEPDCRLHFGLNCGARSCPPVSTYSADSLEDDIAMAALSFCEDDHNVFVDAEKKELHLSTIFSWYKIDFAQRTSELPGAVLKFLRRMKHQDLDRMIDAGDSIKVVFKPYDWNTNASNVKPFDPSQLKTCKRSIQGLLGGSKHLQENDLAQFEE
uniref:Glutaredoxin domain-containing protein n=1 Tax=Amphora coffeiformis TaxID=265554 RepID=A0A7S3P657_9STRA|eukprot:scaffold8374_cov175-Amphora_coffeaeformis.AAC.54